MAAWLPFNAMEKQDSAASCRFASTLIFAAAVVQASKVPSAHAATAASASAEVPVSAASTACAPALDRADACPPAAPPAANRSSRAATASIAADVVPSWAVPSWAVPAARPVPASALALRPSSVGDISAAGSDAGAPATSAQVQCHCRVKAIAESKQSGSPVLFDMFHICVASRLA